MKILHFIYDHINNPWVGGGGAVRAYELNKRLAQKGHKITIISGNYPGAKDYEHGNLTYKFIGSQKNYYYSTFSYAFQANKLLKKSYKNYDIIVEDFAPWNPIFSYKIQKNKKVFLQLHQREGIEILKRHLFLGIPFYIIEQTYPYKFKYVCCNTEFVRKLYHIDNAFVISNGIDDSYINEKVCNNKGNYCLFLGRIDYYHKGIDILLNAWQELDIPLVIAGEGKDKNKLEKDIMNLNNIKYIGPVRGKEKKDLIKNALLTIMPSRYEGQGIVALESAALGTPLLINDIDALKYVIESNIGISFQKNNYKDLKEKVIHLLKNKNLLSKLGTNGKNFAKKFTWDKISEEYEKFLEKIYRDN